MKTAVESMIRHRNKNLRELAQKSLALMEAAERGGEVSDSDLQDVETLLEELQSPDIEIRRYALASLARDHPADPRTVPILLESLGNPRTALGASLALIRLGDSVVEPMVSALRSAPDETVSWIAFTLGRIGAEARPAIPALLRLTSDENWITRANAVQALGRIAGHEPGVRAVVQVLLNDPVEEVQRYARVASSRLGSAGRPARDDTHWQDLLHPPYQCGWTEERTYHEKFCTRLKEN